MEQTGKKNKGKRRVKSFNYSIMASPRKQPLPQIRGLSIIHTWSVITQFNNYR